mgnify:CR=1 FL=1
MKLIDISRISVLSLHYNNYTLDYFLDCQAKLGVKNVELLGAHQGLWMDEYGYQDAAPIRKKLEERGLVYPCFCSRAQLHAASAPHTSDGNVVYPGTCRGLTAAEIEEKRKKKAPAYRLMVPDEDITFVDGCMGPHTENLLHDCGDFYLRRADGVFAYQLAVVVDDARMGVTEVVRGSDLLSSTARQLYLYRLLGLQAPGFAHCPLLLAPDGRRLSKRDGDQSLENLREKYTAQEIVGKLAYAYGLQPEPAPRTPESLIKDFSWAKVPKQDVCLPEDLF